MKGVGGVEGGEGVYLGEFDGFVASRHQVSRDLRAIA